MATELPPVVIEVTAKVEQIKAALAEVEAKLKQMGGAATDTAPKMDKLGSSFREAAKWAGGLLVLGQAVSYLKEAGHAASEDATSQAQLARQLEISAGANAKMTGAVEAQIKQLSLMSGVYDDDIRNSISAFVRVTKDAQTATAMSSLALDVAAGSGKDLSTVTQAMAKALSGSTGALDKLVPGAKNATDKIAFLQQTFKGAAETAANADPYKRLNVAFDSIKESVGYALLPVIQKFATWLVDVVPAIEAFFAALTDPTTTVGAMFDGLTKTFMDTFDWISKNFEMVKNLAIALGVMAGAAKIAAIAQGILNIAMDANPIGLVAAAVFGLVAALTALYNLISTHAGEKQAIVNTKAMEAGQKAYDKALRDKSDWEQTPTGPVMSPAAMQRAEKARTDAEQAYLKAHKVKTDVAKSDLPKVDTTIPDYSKIFDKITIPDTSAADKAAAALKKHQAEVKKFTKAMEADVAKAAAAREKYDKAETDAYSAFYKKQDEIYATFNDDKLKIEQKRDADLAKLESNHAKNVLKIQSDFAKKFSDIIAQSMNLMRDAFKQATSVDVGSIFASSLASSSLSSTLARQVKDGLTTVVSWWGSPASGGGVAGLLKTLQDKLAASKQLSDNAAKLSGAGFSQNFIDQVLAQGTDVGNTMSQAILDASPELQKQLASTFEEASTYSQHGVDALASQLYETQGLANEALRAMWDQTTADQKAALDEETANYLDAQKTILADFDTALKDITKKRDDALTAANDVLKSALKDAKDSLLATLKDINNAIAATIKEMGNLNSGAAAKAKAAVSNASVGVYSAPASQFGSATPWAQAAAANGLKIETNITTTNMTDPQAAANYVTNAIKLNTPLIASASGSGSAIYA